MARAAVTGGGLLFSHDRLEVTPDEIAPVHSEAASDPKVLLVDIREPFERELCVIRGSLHLPMGEIPTRWPEVPVDLPVVLYCHRGIRSLYAVQYLRARGFPGVWSLEGGVDLWARSVDPDMPRY